MKTVKKIISIILSVLLWVVILIAALFAFTTLATRDNTRVSNVLGYTPMVVQTESMAPTFNAEDLIIIKQCDPATLQVGDIITFHTIIQNEYALNTHRIVSIDVVNGARSYTTKGDNNLIEDPHIVGDGDIVGKYITHLPKFGKVINFLSSSVGFLLVIVLPMLAFFIYQIYHLITVSVRLKKAVAAEAAEESASEDASKAEAAQAEAEAAKAEAQRLKEELEQLRAAQKPAEESTES
ncbi:MAG: signal peptidase I [Oscillospiraceae bacterium]|nr:signal peptidase I [Oscillospiraceae bacterium]